MSGPAMDHARVEEIVAAYALGSLERGDEAERELLEHLPGCASCLALFRDLREVSADLALAAPPRAVPSDLEARILTRIRGEAQPAVVRTPVVRSLSMRVGTVAALVALVVAGGLGAWNVSLSGRLDRAEQHAALAAEALAIVGDPAATVVPLTGTRGGSLVLAYRRDGRAVLVGSGIPDPGPGKVLQLWLVPGAGGVVGPGGPKIGTAGIFRPAQGTVVLPVRPDPRTFLNFAVTVEKRLEAFPTTEPIYRSNVKEKSE